MFLLAFDRELLDNDNAGIKSYQALWMRIQNEIISRKFNRFTDIVDMDRLIEQIFTPELVVEMSRKLADAVTAAGIADIGGVHVCPVGPDLAGDILAQSRVGAVALPGLVNRATLGGEQNV